MYIDVTIGDDNIDYPGVLPGGGGVLGGDGGGLQRLPDEGRRVGAGRGVRHRGGRGVDGLVVLVRVPVIVHQVVRVTGERQIVQIVVVRVTVGLVADVAVIIDRVVPRLLLTAEFNIIF